MSLLGPKLLYSGGLLFSGTFSLCTGYCYNTELNFYQLFHGVSRNRCSPVSVYLSTFPLKICTTRSPLKICTIYFHYGFVPLTVTRGNRANIDVSCCDSTYQHWKKRENWYLLHTPLLPRQIFKQQQKIVYLQQANRERKPWLRLTLCPLAQLSQHKYWVYLLLGKKSGRRKVGTPSQR